MESSKNGEPPGKRRGTVQSGFSVPELLPGILLCAIVASIAVAIQILEERTFEHPYAEAIVIAILLGMAVRTVWDFPAAWRTGVAFSAKQILEVAVVLLGGSLSFAAIAASGAALFAAVVATVVATLTASYFISRALGLSAKLSVLIACGNSICGNSAIATVAPVIGAGSDEIASSISFTAILGVLMTLGLPLLIPLLGLSPTQYGILAGLTVYAVPQVLAATVPVGFISTQIGTLVKLIRVLMLGPLVVCISIFLQVRGKRASGSRSLVSNLPKLVPWFILGFLALATLRSLSLIPDDAVRPITKFASYLTVISMAALGLSVDIRDLSRVGPKITAAVTLSLMVLTGIGLVLIRFFN